MLQNRVHGVPRLLPGDSKELLQRSSHRGKDRLSGFIGIHGQRACRRIGVLESADVSEGVFRRDDEARPPLPHAPLVLQFLMKSVVVTASIGSPGIVVGVDSGGGGGAHFRLHVAAAVDRIHFEFGGVGVFDAAVSDGGSGTSRTGNRLQKRIVRRKFFVVLLETLHGGALYAEFSESEAACFSVRRSRHFNDESRRQMANLHKYHGEVMKEQESIDQRNCKCDNVVVMMIIALNNSDDVEEPEAEGEDEDEEEDEGAEHEDAGEGGLGEAVEAGPKAEEEEEEFEGEGDEETLAFGPTSHGRRLGGVGEKTRDHRQLWE